MVQDCILTIVVRRRQKNYKSAEAVNAAMYNNTPPLEMKNENDS
jgi:hypothetical protein